MATRELSEPTEPRKESDKAVHVDAGLVPLVEVLKRQRRRKGMTLTSLARRADVSIETIQRFEAYQVNSVGLTDLLSIAAALGGRLTVQLAAKKRPLPIASR